MIFTDAEISRFWTKVDKTDGCWLWTAGTQSRGYGAIGYAPWTADDRLQMAAAHDVPILKAFSNYRLYRSHVARDSA